jgi:hypothetical protein
MTCTPLCDPVEVICDTMHPTCFHALLHTCLQAEVREVLRRADARRAAAGGIPNPPMALATPRDLDSAHWWVGTACVGG